jgi:hypothetical protein
MRSRTGDGFAERSGEALLPCVTDFEVILPSGHDPGANSKPFRNVGDLRIRLIADGCRRIAREAQSTAFVERTAWVGRHALDRQARSIGHNSKQVFLTQRRKSRTTKCHRGSRNFSASRDLAANTERSTNSMLRFSVVLRGAQSSSVLEKLAFQRTTTCPGQPMSRAQAFRIDQPLDIQEQEYGRGERHDPRNMNDSAH